MVLMIISSLAETVSISTVLPFLAAITNPQEVFDHDDAKFIIEKLNLTSPEDIILPLTLIFLVFTITSAFIRTLMLMVNTRVAFSTGSEVSVTIYRKILFQPYIVHVSRNSSEIINSIATQINALIHIIVASLNLLCSIVVIASITILLVFINAIVALTTIACFALIYLTISNLTKKRLLSNGRVIVIENNRVIRCLQEGLGGIRDITISGTQDIYCKTYQEADRSARKAQGNTLFISASPRYIVEAFGMVLIALIAYILTFRTNLGDHHTIPILGLFALAAQRLLPNLQQAYGAWASIQGELASFENLLKLLSEPDSEQKVRQQRPVLNFTNRIELKDISFRYSSDSPWIFKNLNLTIKACARVGIFGVTGGGKSTLMDIIMGLLSPSGGAVLVDGVEINSNNVREWQNIIAHVPQDIFLIDKSVAENIAFGERLDEIDWDRITVAATQAKIIDTIDGWPNGFNTIVGERGVKISGGQRQRLGIARALYTSPSIIVFDEATSALDIETEQEVMQSIERLGRDVTILIVTHRTTTLKSCDQVIQLDSKGNIINAGTYNQLFRNGDNIII